MKMTKKIPTMILQLLPDGVEIRQRMKSRTDHLIFLQKTHDFERLGVLEHRSWRYNMLWLAAILIGLGVGLIVDGLLSQTLLFPLMVVLVPPVSGWVLGKKEDSLWLRDISVRQGEQIPSA